MKVTRSYWLGLGSGLILSAMLTLVIPLNRQQIATPQEPASVPTIKQQSPTQPLAEEAKQADRPSSAQTSVSTQLPQNQSPDTQKSIQIEQKFSIPNGASSERIADLLLAQGLIKDKASFLVCVHQMGVESQFKVGTFTLSLGLTSEEVINRLLK